MKAQDCNAVVEKLFQNLEEARKLAGKYAAGSKNEIGLVSNLMKEIARLRDVIEKIEREDFSWCSKEQSERLMFLGVMMEEEDFGRLSEYKRELVKDFCRKSLE